MEDDKKNKDEYPKLSENDKRWKQQDEFDSAGAQQQLENEESNAAIAESNDNSVEKDDDNNNNTYSAKAGESTRRDREQS